MLTGAGDGTARLWDAATAKQLRVFNLEKKDRAVVEAAAFSPDGKWIAAGGYENSVGYCTVWDAATGKELRTQGVPSTSRAPGVLTGWPEVGNRLGSHYSCLGFLEWQGTNCDREAAKGHSWIITSLRARRQHLDMG